MVRWPCSCEHLFLDCHHWRLNHRGKKPDLSVRVFKPASSGGEMLWIALNADIPHAGAQCRHANWRVAHEWVQNHVARLAVQGQEVLKKLDRLWRWILWSHSGHLSPIQSRYPPLIAVNWARGIFCEQAPDAPSPTLDERLSSRLMVAGWRRALPTRCLVIVCPTVGC